MDEHTVGKILQAGAEAGVAPGFVAAWIDPGQGARHAAVGVLGLDNPAPMRPDTIFWIASLTKAITTAAALQLVERGVLALDEPVGAKLPALAAPRVLTGFGPDGQPRTRAARMQITLRHLLAHTSGHAYDFCNADLTRYTAATGASPMATNPPDAPLVFDPGEGWQYGIGLDWTGKLIEAATGERFDAYLRRAIFEPLGMADTTFFPDAAQAQRRASVHARLPDGGLTPIAFAMPTEPHFGMGGGGLYSTAPDYLKFLATILGGGGAGGERILSPESLAAMTTGRVSGPHVGVLKSANPTLSNDFDPFPGMDKAWGVGFVLNQEEGPAGRSAGSLAWAGLANCYYWADPARGVAGVLLAQVLPFADKAVLRVFGEFERAVYQSATQTAASA